MGTARPQDSVPGRGGRPGWRLARWTVVLLLLAVGANALLTSAGLRRWMAREVERLASEATGELVTVGDVLVRPARREVKLEGVLVRSAVEESPWAVARSARLVFGWRQGPVVALVELDEPRLHLHVDADGLRELRHLPTRTGEPWRRVPWDDLAVRDGTFALDLPGGHLRVESIQLRPELERGRGDLTTGRVRAEWRDLVVDLPALVVPRVAVGPDRFEVPDVAISTDGLSLRGGGSVLLDGSVGATLSSRLSLRRLDPLLGTELGLDGEVWVDGEVEGTLGEPEARGALVATPRVFIRQPGWPERSVDLERFTLAWTADRHGATLGQGHWDWAGGRILLDAAVGWDGTVSRLAVVGEAVSLWGAMHQLAASPAPWVDASVDLEVAVAGTLVPLDLGGTFDLAALDLLVATGDARGAGNLLLLDVPWLAASGDVDVRPGAFRLRSRRFTSHLAEGRVDADIQLRPSGFLDARFRLDPVDLRAFRPLAGLELLGTGVVEGVVRGPFVDLEVTGSLDLEHFGAVGYHWGDHLVTPVETVDLRLLRFPGLRSTLGASVAHGDLQIDLRDPSFDDEVSLAADLVVEQAHVADLVTIVGELPGVDALASGAVNLYGPPDRLGGEAYLELRQATLYGEEFPTGTATGFLRDGRFTLQHLLLERQDGAGLLARGSLEPDGRVDAEVLGDGLRVELLDRVAALGAGFPVRGVLGLDARVGGTLAQLEPEGRLTLRQTRVAGAAAEDSVVTFGTVDRVMSFHGELLGQSVVARGTVGLRDDGPWAASLTLTDVPAELLHPVAADGRPITARLWGEAEVFGTLLAPLDRPDAPPQVQGKGVLERVTLAWADQRLENPRPWRWRQDGRRLSLDDLSLVGGTSRLELSLSTDGEGHTWLDGDGTLDATLLQALVPDVVRADGQIDLTLDARGAEPSMRASTSGLDLRLRYFPHPIEDAQVSVSGDARGYRVERVVAGLGGGTVVGAGTLTAEGWVPTWVDLSATGGDVRVRLFDFLPSARGDLRLRLAGPLDDLLLSGTVDVAEMTFRDRVDWEEDLLDFQEDLEATGSLISPSDALFDLDLQVRSQGGVRLDNNLAQGVADAELHVMGDSVRPGMTGLVRMQPGGTVTIQNRVFEVARAEVLYEEPFTWEPEVDLLLQADVRSRDTDYRIRYEITGPYVDVTTRASSDPTLSQGDINALLLFGMTRADLERYGGVNTTLLAEGADLLGYDLEERTLGTLGSDILRLDRLDLVTGMAARGNGISSDWRLRAEKHLPEPVDVTLVGEVNLTQAGGTYLSAERRLGQWVYASAFWSSEAVEDGLPLEGALGVDFLFRWEWE